MRATSLALAASLIALPALAADAPAVRPGEEPVAAYVQSDANAGATPITDPRVFQAFHGEAGVDRIVAELQRLNGSDPRISDIFKAADKARLHRTLTEQFCYILGGPCHYTGMDMATSHKDMGLQISDMNALVENLQKAMDKEGVPFADQNKLLAKLAPQKRDMIER